MSDIEISEKTLENMIMEYAKENNHFPHTEESYQFHANQVNIGSYGIADIVCIDVMPLSGTSGVDVDVKIIELKKGIIDINAILQISRYKTGIEHIISRISGVRNCCVSGELIGSGYGSGDECFLIDSMEWLDMYSYDLGIHTGVTFNYESGWIKKDIGNVSVFTDFIAKLSEPAKDHPTELSSEKDS